MDLGLIFLTGLTVGGLTCLAVQGGLLASVIAAREESVTTDRKRHALYASGAFLVAKFLAYTCLGFVLGAFGGALNISDKVQTFMQLLAGLYMIAIALNLLNIHPIFRYAVLQPPRFLTRMVRNRSKSKDIFAPALLGAMTIFIPCGTTLGMEALAISSANPLHGAAIMAAFTLGTVPLFFSIGYLTSVLGDTFKTKFLKLAAVAVIYIGITSVNGALIALGFPITSESIIHSLQTPPETDQSSVAGITQNPVINVSAGGYSPDYIRVKKGSPVTLTLISKNAYSCASAFRIPAFGISRNLQPNEKYTVNFTPDKTGKFTMSCSMGMFTGVIEVI